MGVVKGREGEKWGRAANIHQVPGLFQVVGIDLETAVTGDHSPKGG